MELNISERLAKLFKELDFEKDSKEHKMFSAIIDEVRVLEEVLIDNILRTDEIDEDLAEMEGEYYGDEYDDDDGLFEMTCPHCDSKIFADEDMLQGDVLTCPTCGEEIDFEIDLGDLGCSGGCGGCHGCE